MCAAPFFALTPDGGSVVTASPDGELAWWDIGSREKTRALEIADGYHALALSPDGLTAAVGIDGGIQLVDVRSGEVRTEQAGLDGSPSWLLFSPDGKTLVSTGLDGAVTLWDAETAAPRETLRGHSASVGQPVFSPDGATLYTASDDGTAIAWDLDGRPRAGASVQVHARSGVRSGSTAPGEVQPGRTADRVGLKEEGIRLWDATDPDPGGHAASGDRRRGQGARVQPGRANARSSHRRGAWRRSGTWSRARSATDRSLSGRLLSA